MQETRILPITQTRHLNDLSKDVVALTQDLIRYPSVTPQDHGCLTHLAELLDAQGWETHIVLYNEVTNLYARIGKTGKHLCFAGHVDVVPTGPEDKWTHPPFDPVIQDGFLFGRGVADMKGGIACFLSALQAFKRPENASISLILTSDEEGDAIDGTKRMVQWMNDRNQRPDVFLIGEPTGNTVGSVIQIGRRGSLTGRLEVLGKQGHIAYPEAFDNPVSKVVKCAQALMDMPLDSAMDTDFEASRLEITSIDTGNPATNVIWGSARAHFGVRFNAQHTGQDLQEKITDLCKTTIDTTPQMRISGNAFISKDPAWTACVHKALKNITHHDPKPTTKGGITDGRFLIELGPVLEVGLPEDTMHQIDERVAIDSLYSLRACYISILQEYFS